ncbi:hypothetical protein Tcan_16924 [Toxocara canis]|uniref:Uncharacterized protein n=1 Tax=Toxocara canis TaxID=6265 RepID=A0A0B2VKS6_TOXCA|nr:hypothetical protein Tcan_16924 [Toxocara canis]
MSEETITISPSTDGSATSEPLSFSSATANVNRQLAPWWMYALMIVAILCAIVALSLLVISQYQAKKCSQTHMQTIISATTNISDSCKAYNNIEKKDLDIKAKNEKGSSLDAIVGTKKRSDVSNGIDTGNSSSGPQKFNYDIKSEMQQGQSKQLEDVTSKPSINFHFFDKNSYEEDAENSGKCSEHSPYSLHIISVSASGQPQLQNINEEKPVSSSSPILDDHEPDTENKGTLQKDTDLSSSDASCAIEGNFVNRSSNCAREFQTSAKSGEQSIKEERLSIAESEDLEYRCEVTRPTTPPKLATRVHLDATALSTDSIAISSSTTRDYSELNTFSLSDLPTPFC